MSSLHPVAAQAHAAAQWQRNKYAICTDLALGLLFIVKAKLFDLRTAALVAAGAGLLLVVVQRFVKVDLLGGLALFGIAMLLLSAAFSWYFEDEALIKQKGTILGLLTATLFLGDGLLNRGRYFGARLSRYVFEPVDVRRLAIGLGALGALMAALNYAVARWLPTDIWLAYNSVGDIVVTMLLFSFVLRFARA